MCLYGLPNGTWAVTLPADEVPPELPEPALGINFARDGMQEKDWLSLIAVHSDSWLLSVAFYFGARFGFDKKARFASNSFFSLLICITFSQTGHFNSICSITLLKNSHVALYYVQGCVYLYADSSVMVDL